MDNPSTADDSPTHLLALTTLEAMYLSGYAAIGRWLCRGMPEVDKLKSVEIAVSLQRMMNATPNGMEIESAAMDKIVALVQSFPSTPPKGFRG